MTQGDISKAKYSSEQIFNKLRSEKCFTIKARKLLRDR